MALVTPTDLTATSKVGPAPKQPLPAKQMDTSVANQTPGEVTQGTPQSQDPLAPKWAALARQQQSVRAQQKALEEQRKAWIAEKETLAKEAEQAKALKAKLSQDPYGALLDLGITADQAAALLLNQPNPVDQRVLMLQEELKALKASQEQSQTNFQELQNQQYEEAKRQISADVTSLVKSNESFETIKAMGAEDAVVELIEQTFNETGELLSTEDAANQVEEYLLEQALSFAKLKKVQSKLSPAQELHAGDTQSQPKQQINTLSNRMVQSTQPRTMKDRVARAKMIAAGLDPDTGEKIK